MADRVRRESGAQRVVLSPSEEEVLALLGDGLTLQQIADARHTCIETSAFFAKRLKRKFGVNASRELVPVARRYFRML